MLNGAGDSEREIKFGGDGLAGGADLAIHGEPAGIANRARGGEFSAQSFGQLLGDVDVFLFLDAAAHGDNDLGLGQIDGLLGFLEDFLRLVADDAVGDVDCHRFDRSWAGACLDFIAAERAVLESDEPGGLAGKADVGDELALKHLAGEEEFLPFFLIANSIADNRAMQRGGKLGNEIAHLVGVRHQDEGGLFVADELLERGGEPVRGVRLEFGVLDRVDPGDFLAGNFHGERGYAASD